jgi:NADH-quinone oxidoreductase subunit L
MPELMDKPGLLFVLATLLPICSFGLLFLNAGLRWALRPYTGDNAGVKSIFDMLGGEVTGRGPAYVALGGIGLAFVCSFIGFVIFLSDTHEIEHVQHEIHEYEHGSPGAHGHDDHGHAKKPEKEVKKDDAKDIKAAKEAKQKAKDKYFQNVGHLNALMGHWHGSIEWAHIFPDPKNDYYIKDLPNKEVETLRIHGHGTILSLGFRIDMLSAVMFMMVTFIATLIHLFSIGYMTDELQQSVEDHEVHMVHGHLHRRGRYGRFFMFLSLFCFSMLNLILTDNLFQIFVSWELVGICSYLLIGFYFERTSASNAANKAFITNRIGDAGFIIGLLIIWTYFGTFNFQEIFAQIRCPVEGDSHGTIKFDGTPALDRIVRGNSYDIVDNKQRRIKLDSNGDTAVIFPRSIPSDMEKEHWHGPSSTRYFYDRPTPTQYSFIPYWLLVAAGLGIFLGCVGKSAQFPLQVWLPDAMEGPTPVSALIHAATMVAAGVYLVGRCYPLFTAEVLLTIAYVGAITLFVAASIALVMTDIKKVLAYSTVSQLGYMMLSLGVGGWMAGELHLLTHAFFKALLFLGSGSVIYGCHHQQDMHKMGGLYPKMKVTALTMLMGVLAISGTPFFSGWYSKDDILVSAYSFAVTSPHHLLLFILPLAGAGLTTFYMFRMWFMTFCGKPRDHHVFEHANESPWVMTVPLILLAVLSVCVAWGPPDHPGQSVLGHLLAEHAEPASVQADFAKELMVSGSHDNPNHDTHSLVGALALAVVGIGLAFAAAMYYYGVLDPTDAKEQFPGVHAFLANKWYFDELYSAMLVRPSLAVAHWCRNFDAYVIDGFVHMFARWNLFASMWSGRFDKGVVDGFVNVFADASYAVGLWLRNIQTGYLRSYILFLALAAMAIWGLLYAWASAMGG